MPNLYSCEHRRFRTKQTSYSICVPTCSNNYFKEHQKAIKKESTELTGYNNCQWKKTDANLGAHHRQPILRFADVKTSMPFNSARRLISLKSQ